MHDLDRFLIIHLVIMACVGAYFPELFQQHKYAILISQVALIFGWILLRPMTFKGFEFNLITASNKIIMKPFVIILILLFSYKTISNFFS